MSKGIPNKKYTGEFKQMVVETMRREGLSYRETAVQFRVCNHHRIESWERIYLEEGTEGLYIERRGNSGKGRTRPLSKKAEEDLIAEVQRLQFKAELVDYLDYYNNRRIKAKLKGLPPALHRQQTLSVA